MEMHQKTYRKNVKLILMKLKITQAKTIIYIVFIHSLIWVYAQCSYIGNVKFNIRKYF